jgi:hypothetical protein
MRLCHELSHCPIPDTAIEALMMFRMPARAINPLANINAHNEASFYTAKRTLHYQIKTAAPTPRRPPQKTADCKPFAHVRDNTL